MKKLLGTLAVVILATRLLAQSNMPVRLALIAETDEAAAASDVLTAQLSATPKIQLLERNEVERVYREQGMSAANRDDLKLGRILGADGLVLLQITTEGTNQFLNVRLVAVKPGVVLAAERFPWPIKDLTGWSPLYVKRLDVLLPKLAVLEKDAIPISVVNLRSAVQSADAQEAERQMKLLTIQRLSREPRFFVLERQRMQWLSEEKEQKSDESAFWDSSYLLEGVVDQNGYSKDTITINARLTPRKGGAPLLFEVSGSRTNYGEVINRLAAKVTQLLKASSVDKEWSAADEAEQYFDEANWALRWGVFSEAQPAADSAWALGKTDLACALVRAKSYLGQLSATVGKYQKGESSISSGFDVNGKPLGQPPREVDVQTMMRDMLSGHPFGAAHRINRYDSESAVVASFAFADAPPNPANIDRAMHLLELYDSFSRTHAEGTPKAGMAATNWKTSEWDEMGIEILVTASKVLQNFNFVPKSQGPVAAKLGELRALTRTVAEFISKIPSVHDSYFVGDRIVTHDELAHTIRERPNIFSCEVKWGVFWSERPEDSVALYRELMTSPVFCYIHKDFWVRELQAPRLAAWNENDRQRIPVVWNDFVRQLDGSTNVLLQLEAKALAVADADSEKNMTTCFTNFFETIFANRDVLVANHVELLYLGWGADDLVNTKTSGGIVTEIKNSLNHLFHSEYLPKLEAMDQEYWKTTVIGMDPSGKQAAFEKQKQYLSANQPFNPQEFVHLFIFGFKDYSRTQALEIQPLLAACKSNLAAQAQGVPNATNGTARIGIMQVGQVENNVNRILHPPAPSPQPSFQPQAPKPAIVAKAVAAPPASANAPEIVTNIMTVNKFLEIPLDGLQGDQISGATITAHHWLEGKLLLDFQYGAFVYSFDDKGNWKKTRNVTFPAIAILDPEAEHWDVIGCPEAGFQEANHFYSRSVLRHGELFTSNNGQIKKFDFKSRQWQPLEISDGSNYELFAVNDHLYAANGNTIFEIMDGGKSTHILASNRREPPGTLLDSQDLWTPALFEGPAHSLRVSTKSKIFTWTGNDWREDFAAPPVSSVPAVFADGVLFLTDGFNETARVSRLSTESNAVEFCLEQDKRPGFHAGYPQVESMAKSTWKLPPDLALHNLPAATRRSELYLLVDHSEAQDIVDEQQHLIVGRKMLAKGGYHAELLCFSPDLPLPQKLFVKFEAPDACPPVTGKSPSTPVMFPELPPAWMLFTTNLLFLALERPDNFMPVVSQRPDIGCKVGVWLMPVSQLDSAISVQKQIQLEQKAKAEAAMERAQKDFVAKYDRNHNGIIDPEEREEALDDPAFIESQLDKIDANHNGRLDLEELVWFDANQNKILEPKEQAGMDIAQHLLAGRLLIKYDADGDGLLDQTEFNNLAQSSTAANARPRPGSSLSFPNDNQDGKVDPGELASFLKQQMRKELRSRGGMPARQNQPATVPGQPVDLRQLSQQLSQQQFKSSVEAYWRNPGGVTNRPPQ